VKERGDCLLLIETALGGKIEHVGAIAMSTAIIRLPVDHSDPRPSAEFRIGRRKLFSGDRRRSLGRTRNARDLLSRYRNATEGEKTRPCKQGTTDSHGENPHAECYCAELRETRALNRQGARISHMQL
jgi:hypothetical protein